MRGYMAGLVASHNPEIGLARIYCTVASGEVHIKKRKSLIHLGYVLYQIGRWNHAERLHKLVEADDLLVGLFGHREGACDCFLGGNSDTARERLTQLR